MCQRAARRQQFTLTSVVDLWTFFFPLRCKTQLKISKRLTRLDGEASCPFFFLKLFFFQPPQRCTCCRIPDCGDQSHRQSCDSQTPPCPRPRLTASLGWLAITSARLFLPLSYDVLWPCSGSRTVTVLSPAPSDRHTVPRHMRAPCRAAAPGRPC